MLRFIFIALLALCLSACVSLDTFFSQFRGENRSSEVSQEVWSERVQSDLSSGSADFLPATSFLDLLPICFPASKSSLLTKVCGLWLGITEDLRVYTFSIAPGVATYESSIPAVLLGELPGPYSQIAVNASGNSLVYSYQNSVTVVGLEDLEVVSKVNRIASDIQSLAVSPVEDSVILGAADGRVYRWAWGIDAHPSQRKQGRFDLERYFGHSNVVSAVGYHPAGRVFFSGDWNGTVIAWKGYDQDPYGGAYDRNIFGTGFFTGTTARRPLPGVLAQRVEILRFDVGGEVLASGYGTGEIDLWRLRGLEKMIRISHHRGSLRYLSLSADASRVVSYGRDQRLVVSEIESTAEQAFGNTLYTAKEIFAESMTDLTALSFIDETRLLLAGKDGVRIIALPESVSTEDNGV